MRKLRRVDSAKIWQQDYARLQEFPDDERYYRLSDRDINLLLSFVAYQATWQTRWGGYDDFADVLEYVTSVIIKLITPVQCEGGAAMAQQQCAMYQKVDGVWHIGFDCGCGVVEWVPLGTGGAIGTGGAYAGRDTETMYLPSGTSIPPNSTCLGAKLAPYFADAAVNFWNWTVDATITAIEYIDFAAPITEFFDAASLIADMLSGSGTIRELTNLGIEVIEGILLNQANVDALAANMNFTTAPTYRQVNDAVNATTFPVESGTAKKLYQGWAVRVILSTHLKAINAMIAECATSTTLGSLASSEAVGNIDSYTVKRITSAIGKTANVVANVDSVIVEALPAKTVLYWLRYEITGTINAGYNHPPLDAQGYYFVNDGTGYMHTLDQEADLVALFALVVPQSTGAALQTSPPNVVTLGGCDIIMNQNPNASAALTVTDLYVMIDNNLTA